MKLLLASIINVINEIVKIVSKVADCEDWQRLGLGLKFKAGKNSWPNIAAQGPMTDLPTDPKTSWSRAPSEPQRPREGRQDEDG